MKKLGDYINGNTRVRLYEDGSRIVETLNPTDKKVIYDFPLNFDICITKYCDGNCAYCHEGATKNGKHGDILSLKFIDSLVPGTEMAIGGGNALDHPDLEKFLIKLKDKGVVANITVNQQHAEKNLDKLKYFVDNNLIHGIGISLTNSTNLKFFRDIEQLGNNVVIHVIAGIFNITDLRAICNKKILILGYKNFRRGKAFKKINNKQIRKNIKWLKHNLSILESITKLMAFDCLAIKQLSPKRNLNLSKKIWNILFQKDDLSEEASTMYIDVPNMQVARSSTMPVDKRSSFTGNEDIRELFKMSKRYL